MLNGLKCMVRFIILIMVLIYTLPLTILSTTTYLIYYISPSAYTFINDEFQLILETALDALEGIFKAHIKENIND